MSRDEHWRDSALCANIMFLTPEEIDECETNENLVHSANVRKAHTIFFPGIGDYSSYKEAVSICDKCPVQLDCLAYSLKTNQADGIWGGVSGRSRRRIRAMQNTIVRARLFEDEEYAEEMDRLTDSEWQKVWDSEEFITGMGYDL